MGKKSASRFCDPDNQKAISGLLMFPEKNPEPGYLFQSFQPYMKFKIDK